MNPELARQQAHYKAVRARLGSNPVPQPKPKPKLVDFRLQHDQHIWEYRFHIYEENLAALMSTRPKQIVSEISRKHGVTFEEITSEVRIPRVVHARQELMWRLRTEVLWGTPRIGRFVNRDHSTVLHGIGRHELRLRDAEGREASSVGINAGAVRRVTKRVQACKR